MDEAEWLACISPATLVAFLIDEMPSVRKLELLDESIALNRSSIEEMVGGIHCIFGNPFRPVAVAPSWLTSTVVALANGIYSERAFDRMPILADALQDAGCDNDDVLNHCRGDGPHVRGCWVVDLLTGRE